MNRIRLGIIGASANRGWGKLAHVPAVQHLPEFELTAVGTSTPESASAAASEHGVRHGFSDYRELVQSPDVDAVTIAVRVPWHQEIAAAALAAGKHVYCEWPLAGSIDDGKGMVDAARAGNLKTMVGLQGRFAPWASYIKELVRDGSLGKIYSVNARLGLPHPYHRQGMAWAARRAAGNHLLSIWVPHQLELVFHTVGALVEGSAQVRAQYSSWLIPGEPEPVAADAPDNVALNGVLAGGAALSFHAAFVPAPGTGWRLEVYGEKGTVVSTAPASGGHSHVNSLEGALNGERELRPIEIPERFRLVPADVPATPALNMAHAYREFAQAIAEDRPAQPDFAYGLDTLKMLDAIERSDATGRRVTLGQIT